jgi:DNA-directed RNA polymerase specialized sigma24 family protein
MQTLEQANERVADPRFAGAFRIYWLAFLLTGHREPSLDVAIEALDFQDGANSFFSTWMLAWSRRVVIAKALAAIRDELAASARRTASKRAQKSALPLRNWVLDHHATKVQLERALLAVDVFPRCALLLSIFEGMSLEDTAILLDADRRLVRKGQMTGLRELTRNLARMQGWTSTATNRYVVTSEIQHA